MEKPSARIDKIFFLLLENMRRAWVAIVLLAGCLNPQDSSKVNTYHSERKSKPDVVISSYWENYANGLFDSLTIFKPKGPSDDSLSIFYIGLLELSRNSNISQKSNIKAGVFSYLKRRFPSNAFNSRILLDSFPESDQFLLYKYRSLYDPYFSSADSLFFVGKLVLHSPNNFVFKCENIRIGGLSKLANVDTIRLFNELKSNYNLLCVQQLLADYFFIKQNTTRATLIWRFLFNKKYQSKENWANLFHAYLLQHNDSLYSFMKWSSDTLYSLEAVSFLIDKREYDKAAKILKQSYVNDSLNYPAYIVSNLQYSEIFLRIGQTDSGIMSIKSIANDLSLKDTRYSKISAIFFNRKLYLLLAADLLSKNYFDYKALFYKYIGFTTLYNDKDDAYLFTEKLYLDFNIGTKEAYPQYFNEIGF